MKLNKDIIIQKLAEAKPFMQEEFLLSEIALFCSYARNEQTETSDIDLMISEKSKSFRKYQSLYHFLQKLFDGYKVQLVSKSGIKQAYFQRLKNDLLYL